MREILFRGKTKNNREWAFSKCHTATMTCGVEKYEYIPETVGQFTGQTDMIGRKIFEGDILQTEDRLVVVMWNNNAGCWDSKFVRYIEKPSTTGILYSQWRRWATVIGNIHDNPELLVGIRIL